MNFLNNTTLITDIIFTDFAIKNGKTINDIVKFGIADDDIDYNYTTSAIKYFPIISPSIVENVKYNIKNDNLNLTDLEFNFEIDSASGNYTIDNLGNIFVIDSEYITITCINENNLYIEFTDLNFIKSIIIDESNTPILVNNIKNNYIQIKNKIQLNFSDIVKTSKISFYSNSHEFGSTFNITLSHIKNILSSPIVGNPIDSQIYNIDINSFPYEILFNWNPISNADRYEIQISTDINFNYYNILQDQIVKTNSFKTQFDEYGIYYWKVKAFNTNNYLIDSEYSKVFTFTIDQLNIVNVKLPSPIIGNPLDNSNYNSLTYPLTISMSWNIIKGADSYNLQISSDSNFDNIIYDQIINSNNKDISVNYPGIYYWRVKALNSLNNNSSSNFSNIFKFTVQQLSNNSKLPAPIVTNPLDNSILELDSLNLNINWNKIENANSYEIQISDSLAFNKILIDTIFNTNSGNITLPNYGQFYWRIKSITTNDNYVSSDFSKIFNFTIKLKNI